MEVPTMEINVHGHPVVINVEDFDPATMARWEAPHAVPDPPTPTSAPEPLRVQLPAASGEDLSESARRRPSRG